MNYRPTKGYALQYGCRYDRVKSVLDAAGLRWVRRIEPGDLQLHEEIHVSEERGIVVRFVEDHFVEINLLRVDADRGEEIVALAAELGEQIELFDLLDLEQIGQRDDLVSWSFAVRGMAALLQDQWGAARKAIERGLVDERRDARRVALRVIARLSWADFVPALEGALSQENDEGVRDEIQILIAGLQKYGKKPTGFLDW
jgi:hypothetical protein